MRAPDEEPSRDQLSEALMLLDPPPAERERWRREVRAWLGWLEPDGSVNRDQALRSGQGKEALKRYARALRELRASRAALNPSMQEILALKVSAIEHDIAHAEGMLSMAARSPKTGRPYNYSARLAVSSARALLETGGIELTTERKGKWHLMSQIFAGTKQDLRHHLIASLAEK
jgi:hypothetical protein